MNRSPLIAHFTLQMIRALTLGGLFSVAMVGCGKKHFDTTQLTNGTARGLMTPEEASRAAYRFSFTGQVTSAKSQAVISEFSVSLLPPANLDAVVINPLGQTNGIFHLSRAKGTGPVMVLISAPSHEPLLKSLALGEDCSPKSCKALTPTVIALKPKTISASELPLENLSPLNLEAVITQKTAVLLHREMLRTGKLDSSLASHLANASNGEMLENVVVVLGNPGAANVAPIVADLLGNVRENKVQPLLGGGLTSLPTLLALLSGPSLETGRALVSVQSLLNYLSPIGRQIASSRGGPLGQVMGTLIHGDSGLAENLRLFVRAVSNRPAATSWAQAGLQSLLESDARTKLGIENSSQWVLSSLLKDSSWETLDKRVGDTQKRLLLAYAGTFLQGLSGVRAAEILPAFNQLVSESGILGLRNFGTDTNLRKKFAVLIPYLDPISRGLQSKDARNLADVMVPLIEKRNPGRSLALLLLQYSDPELGIGVGELSNLFPSLTTWMHELVPAKQIFLSQLVQGTLNEELQEIRVTYDLAESPAVVVRGTARDLFKLALLPNVERLSLY